MYGQPWAMIRSTLRSAYQANFQIRHQENPPNHTADLMLHLLICLAFFGTEGCLVRSTPKSKHVHFKKVKSPLANIISKQARCERLVDHATPSLSGAHQSDPLLVSVFDVMTLGGEGGGGGRESRDTERDSPASTP